MLTNTRRGAYVALECEEPLGLIDMVHEEDSYIRAYVRLIRTADALHASVSRGLIAEGITATQFSTLKVLKLRGPLAQRDIAKYLLKSGGNITIVVDNLEREGLVIRERDKEDRRLVYVRLTPRGHEVFERVYPGHRERIRESVSSLSQSDCEELLALLAIVNPDVDEPACVPELAELGV